MKRKYCAIDNKVCISTGCKYWKSFLVAYKNSLFWEKYKDSDEWSYSCFKDGCEDFDLRRSEHCPVPEECKYMNLHIISQRPISCSVTGGYCKHLPVRDFDIMDKSQADAFLDMALNLKRRMEGK